MKPIIHLNDVVQYMDAVGDQLKTFLNIRTGEFVTLTDEDLGAADEGKNLENFPDWQ